MFNPSIWGYHYFWKHPYTTWKGSMAQLNSHESEGWSWQPKRFLGHRTWEWRSPPPLSPQCNWIVLNYPNKRSIIQHKMSKIRFKWSTTLVFPGGGVVLNYWRSTNSSATIPIPIHDPLDVFEVLNQQGTLRRLAACNKFPSLEAIVHAWLSMMGPKAPDMVTGYI